MKQQLTSRQIIEDYIKTLDSLTNEATAKAYMELAYSKDLLPHDKKTISHAINELKEEAFINKDYELVHLLEWGKIQLYLFDD